MLEDNNDSRRHHLPYTNTGSLRRLWNGLFTLLYCVNKSIVRNTSEIMDSGADIFDAENFSSIGGKAEDYCFSKTISRLMWQCSLRGALVFCFCLQEIFENAEEAKTSKKVVGGPAADISRSTPHKNNPIRRRKFDQKSANSCVVSYFFRFAKMVYSSTRRPRGFQFIQRNIALSHGRN